MITLMRQVSDAQLSKLYDDHKVCYTLLILKYGVNLLTAPVPCVLRQNVLATLITTGSV